MRKEYTDIAFVFVVLSGRIKVDDKDISFECFGHLLHGVTVSRLN